MGTINDKLNKIEQTKTGLRTELNSKGAEVGVNDTFASYVGKLHDLEIVNAQEKTVNPSTSSQTVIPDSEHNALSQVTVNPVTSSIDNNIQSYNIKAGVSILGVEGNVEPDKPDQNKTVNPSTSIQEVTADTGYELAKVTVNPVTASIDSNIASNNIKSGVSILGVNGNVVELNGQTKTVTPSTSQQVITPDTNYNALTEVIINAIPDETSVLNEQDSLLSTQDIKISDLATALDNKIALDLTNATSDATAQAKDIMEGKTAYVNGQKIEGTNNNPDWSEIGYTGTPQEILDGFNYAKQIKDNWNSSITTMNVKYQYDKNLRYFPMVDTSNVNNFTRAFDSSLLEIIPIIDFHNAVYLFRTFFNCISLKRVPLFDTRNVANFQECFQGCSSLQEVPIFNMTSAINTHSMLSNCGNLINAPAFDLSNVKDVAYMYYNCTKLRNVPVYNLSKCTTLQVTFTNCSSLTNESLNNILASLLTLTNAYTRTKTLKDIGLSSAQATTCTGLSNWTACVEAGWTTGY